MPLPPREFVSALRAFDPALRIRWAVRTQMWYIERPMPPRHVRLLAERPNPWKSARGWDLYDGWKEGYVHVLSVHPDLLDHRVFQVLADCDAYRQGGFERISARLDELEAKEEASADRHIETVLEGAASDAFDRLAWLQGRRVVVPDTVETVKAGTDGGTA